MSNQPYKCCHRILTEERLSRDETIEEDKCYNCDGYNQGLGNFGTCSDYIDISHLIAFRKFNLRRELR